MSLLETQWSRFLPIATDFRGSESRKSTDRQGMMLALGA